MIIPALNEAGNLAGTVDATRAAIGDRFEDHEILIFDDGSSDRTGEIADELAANDSHIRVTHNGCNMGFGYNYRKGLELARMCYVALVPGDNEINGDSISAIFALAGQADIVAPYTVNCHVRPRSRQIISHVYTRALNLLFRLDLKYYNGPAVHRTDLARSIPITTFGFAFLSEIMVRLIRSGHSYVEVGMFLQPRAYGRSNALRLRSIFSVIKTVLTLFWSVNGQDRARYGKWGKNVT